MYNIAICDNKFETAEETKNITIEILLKKELKKDIDFSIDTFFTFNDLLKKVIQHKDYFKLLLLETKINNESGLKFARYLQNNYITFSLIYVTAYRDYVFSCFDTKPLSYLLKPVNLQDLEEIIVNDYYQNYVLNNNFLEISSLKKPIKFSDIYYIEAYQHRVLLHTKNDSIRWNGTLSSMEQLLPYSLFCRCHNSFIVNMAYISSIVRYEIKLYTGNVVPVSKLLFLKTSEKYIQFLKYYNKTI